VTLLVVLAIASVFRLTWLINNDTIATPIRRWAIKRDGDIEIGEVGRWSYFVTCPWCVSIWLAPPVALVTVLWGDNRAVLVGLLALSASARTGIVASLLGRVLG
jgi:Protein of unknown function (DUF1360)